MSKQKSTPRPRDARGRFVKRTRRNVDFGDVHPIRDSAGYAE